MKYCCRPWLRRGSRLALAVLVALTVGCDRTPTRYQPNLTFARYQKLAEDAATLRQPEFQEQVDDIQRVVRLFFGTPNEPRLPDFKDPRLDTLFDLSLLMKAAGPVGGDPAVGTGGLYRRHCARCHGISGDGAGPMAALLNPYPQDYRRGVFKFKSTPSTLPPTPRDLQRIVQRGIPGTAMPSFARLSDEQRDALVQYVGYLSIRGLFERSLIREVALDFDIGEPLVAWDIRAQNPDRFQRELEPYKKLAARFFQRWADAPNQVTPVPPPPSDWQSDSSVAQGREQFFTAYTTCSQCHGNTALGDGQTDDYDDLAKELEPTNLTALRDYLALGALPPRKSQPRDLRLGVYRGGNEPEDMFRRIKNGIAGTTMPSVATEVTDDDIWRLIAYVRQLPEDPLNHDE